MLAHFDICAVSGAQILTDFHHDKMGWVETTRPIAPVVDVTRCYRGYLVATIVFSEGDLVMKVLVGVAQCDLSIAFGTTSVPGGFPARIVLDTGSFHQHPSLHDVII